MGIGRTGGAGQVWPDNNTNFLSKRYAHNRESSSLDKFSIVALRRTTNGSAPGAELLVPTSGLHANAELTVVMGGMGTGTGETKGTVVDWTFADLNTFGSANDAPVYVVAASPGVISLTNAVGSQVVGKVMRVGSDAADTVNTVLLSPDFFRGLGNAASIADPGAAASFIAGNVLRGSGGVCTLTGTTGTRTLPLPLIQGQRITIVSVNATAYTVTVTTGIDVAGNVNMAFGAAGDMAILEAVPAAAASALRWKIVVNDGLVLS